MPDSSDATVFITSPVLAMPTNYKFQVTSIMLQVIRVIVQVFHKFLYKFLYNFNLSLRNGNAISY